MDRAEHVKFAKDRALEYCDLDEPAQALSSLFSDLNKHPDTQGHAAVELGAMLALGGHLRTSQQVREFVVGVN